MQGNFLTLERDGNYYNVLRRWKDVVKVYTWNFFLKK